MKIVMTYTPRDGIRRTVCFQAVSCPTKLFHQSFTERLEAAQERFTEEVAQFRIKDCGDRKLSKDMERIFQQRLDAFIHLDETRDPQTQKEPDAPSPFFTFSEQRFDVRDFPTQVSFDELEDWFNKEIRR